MADFPSIKAPDLDLFGEQPVKEKVRTPMEAGYVQSRSRYSGSRRVFEIGWEFLPAADYEVLVAFFDSIGGAAFNWTHPTTGITYTVIFSDDALPKAKPIGRVIDGGGWAISGIKLETLGAV